MRDTDAALALAARVSDGLLTALEMHMLILVKGLLKPIYEKFPLKDLPAAVAKLRAGKVAGRCVVDFNA